jgi:hypothetical protein
MHSIHQTIITLTCQINFLWSIKEDKEEATVKKLKFVYLNLLKVINLKQFYLFVVRQRGKSQTHTRKKCRC